MTSTNALERTRAVVPEANVQRAVQHVRRKLRISVLPHELRRGHAGHCLERGTNLRAIRQVMGHPSLETRWGMIRQASSGSDLADTYTRPGPHQGANPPAEQAIKKERLTLA